MFTTLFVCGVCTCVFMCESSTHVAHTTKAGRTRWSGSSKRAGVAFCQTNVLWVFFFHVLSYIMYITYIDLHFITLHCIICFLLKVIIPIVFTHNCLLFVTWFEVHNDLMRSLYFINELNIHCILLITRLGSEAWFEAHTDILRWLPCFSEGYFHYTSLIDLIWFEKWFEVQNDMPRSFFNAEIFSFLFLM